MQIKKAVFFLFQSITVGLALAFFVLVLRPDLLGLNNKPVVEFQESHDTAPAVTAGAPASYASAVSAAAPAVVNIYTRKMVADRANTDGQDPLFRHFFGDRPDAPPRKHLVTSLGSGVIVSSKGYILTNYHVIKGADEIQVALQDGRNVDAKLVGSDPEADLAVLKIGLDKLPTITLGQSDRLRVGDVVMAIGNPFGVGQTVTLGIVSATGRNQVGINTYENFIQTDAAINPGNSGGALINTRGELVGINTAIVSRTGGYQGIGFAIPVSLVKGSMQQIIEQGHVSRGWLGVEVQELTPALAESFGLDNVNGVVIAGVLHGGPADKAGLQPGDILIEVGKKPVNDVRNALDAIARIKPGNEVTVKVVRNGKDLELTAQVAERPYQQQPSR